MPAVIGGNAGTQRGAQGGGELSQRSGPWVLRHTAKIDDDGRAAIERDLEQVDSGQVNAWVGLP